jgi:large subunit ribosomal protein L24
MQVKKGDNVLVTTGKDKGKTGQVVKSIPTLNKVIVEGVNVAKRHMRPRKQGEKGGIVSISLPIDVSNVKLAEAKKKETKTAKAKK